MVEEGASYIAYIMHRENGHVRDDIEKVLVRQIGIFLKDRCQLNLKNNR